MRPRRPRFGQKDLEKPNQENEILKKKASEKKEAERVEAERLLKERLLTELRRREAQML